MTRFFLAILLASACAAQTISPERLRAHVRFLASDLLEGRGVGQRGGDLAVEYLASQLAIAGARPAVNGSWFQQVPLVGVATIGADSGITFTHGQSALAPAWQAEWVGQTGLQTPTVEFGSGAVFVGHGINAPEFGWNDYAGANVRGKTVILFTNEPPSTDAAFFGGPALTYYGRWTYKYEEALRQGAAAAVIIHTNETAGYGWDVVRNSWSGEDFPVKIAPGAGLKLAGWVTRETGEKILAAHGLTVDAALAAANQRGFRARPLSGLQVAGRIHSKVREISTRNVIGRIEGSDPTLRDQAVILTAHWDHLGIEKDAKGDGIFNGAVDNASGCAALLEIARAWSARATRPRRSALFFFTAAEESGLRGAEYYVANPIVPLAKTSAVLNFDSFFPFGAVRDFVTDGAERSTIWGDVQEVAARMGRTLSPNPAPEQGGFFRSDHFPFAKAGLVAFSVSSGTQFLAETEARRKKLEQYEERSYHQPSDEYNDAWDFAALEDAARFGLSLGLQIAESNTRPAWVDASGAAAKKQSKKRARKKK